MEGLVEKINRQHTRQKRRRRIWSMAAALAAFYTTYVLILPAITMSRQLVCGKTEHTHVESCYAAHNVLICGTEEHTHSEFCYDVGPADANADVETPEDWEKAIFSQLTLSGSRGEDVAAVAMTQLGYRESSRNYVYTEGWPINGYTRYGAWYGKPYGDWDAMFASFVLHYAGVDDLGRGEDANAWAKEIAQELPRRYRTAGAYQPSLGDLVFFDRDQDGEIDGTGILAAVSEDTWRIMEGNTEDAVTLVNYAPGDSRIAAYGLVTVPEASETEQITDVASNATEGLPPQGGEAEAAAGENPASPAGSTGSIVLKKQIEKLNTNVDDYSYRLHLTLDGSSLKAGSTTTVGGSEKRRIGILLDVTETMTATSDWGSNGENKFDAVRSLLEGSDGFLNSLLDGNTYVSVIVVGGQSGYGTYEDLSKQIAAGDKPGDFSNINNNLHLAQGISYVTGLKAAEKYLGEDIDSLVYIVGNNPDTHIKYSDGTLERGTSGNNAANADYADYQTFMGKHPGLSMYMVGVAPVNRGSETAQKMGKYSVDRRTGGGYFEANSKDELKEHLTQIAQTITVQPDKVTGITVTDPLSENVVAASDPQLSAILTMQDSNGNAKETKTITDVKLENGVLTCKYPAEIKGPFRLEIAFNIQTAVYRPESGYTNQGEADTGATSAGKPGLFSNGNATAAYTLNGTASTGNFPKPVVQAPPKATITVKKEWSGAADADKKPVTVTLHRGSADGEVVGTVVLNAENGWTKDCDVKVFEADSTKNLIVAVEQAIDGFDASYTPNNVSMAANGEYTITVTNTKQAKTAKLTVTKHWQNVPGTPEAVIHVCVKDGTEYKDIDTFTVSNGEDGSKDFTITWTGETPPEVYIYEERNDAFYPVISGNGTTQNVTIGDTQYSAMKLEPQADGAYAVTLTNMPVIQMPETGGLGTHGFVLSGLALILCAVLLMQIRKIKAERRAT